MIVTQQFKMPAGAGAFIKRLASDTARSIITWSWTKKLLYWLILSAGTMSELAFLVAALWMTLNASVHPLVLLFLAEETTKHISEFATAAYVALPELILGLAFVVTIGHIRLFLYDRKNYTALIWSILYGLPTLVFLALSVITLGNSVASIDFRLPEYLVVTRAIAGYMFAFTSFLYLQLGTPQERDRLASKDNEIASLKAAKDAETASLKAEKERELAAFKELTDGIINELKGVNYGLQMEVTNYKGLLDQSKNQQVALLNALNKSAEDALSGYSEQCLAWLKSGAKSATKEEIVAFTGHKASKVERAIVMGVLEKTPRNDKLITLSSLVAWLKGLPAPATKERETDPHLQIAQ